MSKLDVPLVEQAVKAILAHSHKTSSSTSRAQLIESSPSYILLQIQLNKPVERKILKPFRLDIPHTLFDMENGDCSTCLFVRSQDAKEMETYIENNADLKACNITRVISLDKAVKEYHAFKDRKQLMAEHTHFLCDDRIFSHLINALGKVFGSRHRYPIPIDISDIAKAKGKIIRAISSTYMHLSGSSFSIRVGTTIMKAEDVVENVIAGLDSAIVKLGNQSPNPLKGWSRVMNVYIKTNTSAALPLYSKMPSEVMKFVKKLSNGELATVEEEEKKEEIEEVQKVEEKEPTTEKKKRQKKVPEMDEPKAEKKSTKKAKVAVVEELMEEDESKPEPVLGKTKKLKRALENESTKSAETAPVTSTPVQNKKKKIAKK